ncbi:MAG: glycosyltransferase family 9 protein [Candidatus Palauibacterales bacterium]|nr:glycosyltransferase family 9 protein [Candidatus Palauibacterales bacterium]
MTPLLPTTTAGPPDALPSPPRSVAIVLLSAVGDVVHGMPLPTSLKRAWPECRVTWVIGRAARELVAPHPDVDEFMVYGGGSGLEAAASLRDLRRRTRGRSFDLVLDPQVYLKAGLITALLDAPVKVGFDRERSADLNGLFVDHRLPPREPGHVQDQYFEFLEWLGVDPVPEWRFAFTEGERAARRRFYGRLDRPALAVALRTTEAARDWRPGRWARVLEAAESELGLRPVIVGSDAPAERRVAEEVRSLTGARVVDARENDLRRLAWLLDGAAVAVSPDTGPLHIADAVGTPVVGLYGCTDPERAGPYTSAYRELAVDRWSDPGERAGGEGGAGRRAAAAGGDADPRARRLPDRSSSDEKRPGRMGRITADEVIEKLSLAVDRHVRDGVPADGAPGGEAVG